MEWKARDVGLTFRYYLSNIMPDSIFSDSMGVFLGVVIAVSLDIEEMDSVLSL